MDVIIVMTRVICNGEKSTALILTTHRHHCQTISSLAWSLPLSALCSAPCHLLQRRSRPAGRGSGGFAPSQLRPCRTFTGMWARRMEAEFRERKISPKFFRPKFFHGRPRGMSVPNACFSRIWRAWPKFLAGCPQGCPAQNLLFGLNFRSWELLGGLHQSYPQDVNFSEKISRPISASPGTHPKDPSILKILRRY